MIRQERVIFRVIFPSWAPFGPFLRVFLLRPKVGLGGPFLCKKKTPKKFEGGGKKTLKSGFVVSFAFLFFPAYQQNVYCMGREQVGGASRSVCTFVGERGRLLYGLSEGHQCMPITAGPFVAHFIWKEAFPA